MISNCVQEEFNTIYEIINDGSSACRDLIPADRWRKSYMTEEELKKYMEKEFNSGLHITIK